MTTPAKTRTDRLERAGYRFYSGWLPEKNPAGPKFAAQVEMYAADVDAISAAPRPRGRPKKLTEQA